MDELKIKFSTSRGSSSLHTIYCKRHSVRQPSLKVPNDRTLFTTGWPPYCTKDPIRELFSRLAGQVEEVYLQEGIKSTESDQSLTGGYMIGYVSVTDNGIFLHKTTPSTATPTIMIMSLFNFSFIVFKEEEEVSRALSLCSGESPPLSCCIGDAGLRKWTREYQERYPVQHLLEKAATSGVSAYDEWVESERKRKKHLSEPDEEGWVTVTKKAPIVDK